MPTRRSYLNITQDSKTRLENNSPVNNFNAQGTIKNIVDVMGVELERFYDNLEYIYNAIDPTKAVGIDLDKIGYLVGEFRDSAVTASDYSNTNFYFYIDPRLNWTISTLINRNYNYSEKQTLVSNGYLTVDSFGDATTLTIPQGTTVTTYDGTITYTTVEDANIGSSGDSYVGIVAVNSGPLSNVETNNLVGHKLNEIPELRKIARFIKCSNRFPIQTGKNALSDEEFRYRIATSRSAIRSNEISIRRAALSIPGVRDILFEKNKFGAGTANIIVDGVSPLLSTGLINAVKEKIQQEIAYGDIIYVSAPEYVGIELDFGIVTEPTSEFGDRLRQQARSTTIQYINDLPIGGEIIWNQLVSNILSIEGIIDFIPRTFKLGEYDAFNKINIKQVALRFSNLKAKYNNKFYTDTGLINSCVV